MNRDRGFSWGIEPPRAAESQIVILLCQSQPWKREVVEYTGWGMFNLQLFYQVLISADIIGDVIVKH